MPYGILKVDQVTFTNAGVDQTISVSGIVASISGNITATGTISGNVIRGGTLVSGATVTGTAGQFGTITGNTAGFTTITGTTVTGTTAQFTTVTGGTAGFTTITGTTVTGTTANFVTVSGTTVTGNVGNFTTITGGSAGFTTITGTTITGTTLTVASGTFTGNSTAAAFIPTGSTVPTNGVYLSAANTVAISTNGTGRLFVNSSGNVGVGTASPWNPLSVQLPVPHRLGFGSAITTDADLTLYRWLGTASDYRSANISCRQDGSITFASSTGYSDFSAQSYSERMRLDSSGRLGIGTSSPGDKLEVNGNGLFYGNTGSQNGIFVGANSSYNWSIQRENVSTGRLDFAVTSGGSPSTKMTLTDAGRLGIGVTPSAQLDVKATTGTLFRCEYTGVAQLNIGNGGNSINYYDGDTQIFRSGGGTERARLDSSGRLLVGTSTSIENNALLQTYKASGINQVLVESGSLSNQQYVTYTLKSGNRYADLGIFKHAGITNPGPYLYLGEEDGASAYYWTDNSGNFRVSNNGDHIGTTSGTVVGTQTSDERLKNILGPVEYGLDTLKQIEPVRYALKSEPDTEKLGFIAQQVQPLIPQSVFDTNEHIEGEPEDAPTKLGMEYVALIPVLVNAIKELSAEVDALKAQLA